MRICLTTLGLFLAISVIAQIPRGTISTGGSIAMNFSANKRLHQNTFNFNIVPDVNFFVAKNFSLGTHIGYTFSQVNNTTAKTKDQIQGFIIGPNATYYVKIAPKAFFFLNGKIGYAQSKQIYSSNSIFGVYRGLNWQVGPGLAAFLTPQVSLDISAIYNGTYQSFYLANKNGAVVPSIKETLHGFLFNVGFRVFFFKKMLKASDMPLNKMP